MCGIAGMVQTRADGSLNAEAIHRMCEAILHRGPDDEGIFVKAGVGLGMRRLSIIDLSGGHQPVFNEDKTVWIVFINPSLVEGMTLHTWEAALTAIVSFYFGARS